MTRKNPENQPKLPVESPVSESRPTLESPENVPNTIDRIVDFVKCTVFQVCKKAEVTRETKKAIREKLLLADLGKLLPYHPYVGDTSMSRRLLFGADPKIREIYGSFASESDRKAWDSFMKLPVDQRIKYPLYTTLASKRWDAIGIPETARLDFRQNLKSLWEYKIRKYGGRNTPLKNFYESKILPLIESPKPWTRTTLEKYVGEIDADIDGIVAKMGGIKGYEKTLKEKKWIADPVRIRLLSSIVEQIRGKDLVALSITEIMDKTKGVFNLALFDIILRYGGKEYLTHIPAINDPYISYGNYQHTKYSVGWRNPEDTEAGAVTADRVFTGGKVLKDAEWQPVNIENFPIELHHRAAYLLMVNNITSAISRMPEEFRYIEIEMVKTKNKKWKTIMKEVKKTKVSHPISVLEKCFKKKEWLAMNILLQYVAAAHNNPKYSYDGLLFWLADYEKIGAKTGDNLGEYIDKATARSNAEKQKLNNRSIKKEGALATASK